MDPYVFDLLRRERLRDLAADLSSQQLRDQEIKAPGRSRGAWLSLFDRVRTRFAQVLGSLSARMLTARRLRQWRKVRGTGGTHEQSPT